MKTKFKILFSILCLITLFTFNRRIEGASSVVSTATVDQITLGERSYTDVPVKTSAGNLLILYCEVHTTNVSTCRKNLDSGGYKVTAGKTLTITAIKLCNLASAAGSINLVASQQDWGSDAGAVLGQSSILAGTSTAYEFINGLTASQIPCIVHAVNFTVQSQWYLTITEATNVGSSSSRTAAIAYGYEN